MKLELSLILSLFLLSGTVGASGNMTYFASSSTPACYTSEAQAYGSTKFKVEAEMKSRCGENSLPVPLKHIMDKSACNGTYLQVEFKCMPLNYKEDCAYCL